MNYSLAVFTPQIGTVSETFVRRHMQDLLPNGTVIIAHSLGRQATSDWDIRCPVLVLDQIPRPSLSRRIMWRAYRRVSSRPINPLVLSINRFLRKHHVQVVLGEYLDASMILLESVKELGIRLFVHAHGYDVSMKLRDLHWRSEYLKYDQAAGIIAVSQVSRSRLRKLGLDDSKIHVVPCGVDVPPHAIIRKERETIRCLAVGRMVTKKAPILTLDAFRRAFENCPCLHLDYVGGGPLFPAVRQFVQALGLDNQVTLHGCQPNAVVQNLMRDADIFLQHSMIDPETGDEEGLPVSILEAMAQGTPVISTLHAGIPEAVVDGLTGYLVEEADSKGMANRIVKLSADRALRLRMGIAGWQRAWGHFTWQKEREELLRLLGLEVHQAQ